MRKFLGIVLLITVNLVAQTKGVVKDSLTGSPISYVSVWVENENIGTTSEENGEFSINVNDKNKNLIFSVLGYQRKVLKVSDAGVVLMAPASLELNEVFIVNKKESRQLEIGKIKKLAEAFDKGPRLDAKFFPYSEAYKKTKWIQKVTILTDSKIDNSTIKLHLYEVGENGYPGKELLAKDFIISIERGIHENKIDLSDLNLEMPQNGIFVAFERLIIEKNKLEKKITDYNSNTTKTVITYAPLVLYNPVERDFTFSFSGGRWIKHTKEELKKTATTTTVYEPSVTLILSN
ncbi:carboxypeptidase-like regulatory domain-containing protein [uncultured Flavobacterium sp.]|uniref:carboxypeptidase-like regulatory domain-containing protein n=1 Tax=uncultured Flavobacterium sp. TaxID=165435 RepID=UPI0025DF9655|nr:carboxypeptidase-like regulatory domain-containing protein [uncultured Flavobacterium sp.]